MPTAVPAAPPVVSIILATYNWTSVLRLAIRSVLAQSFRDFELLVVGDCCTDDTEAVVTSFGDPRIRWQNLPQNSGNQAGPNNAGLAMARGEFTAYMHQDDLWFPDHLEVLVPAMREGGAPLAHTLALDVSPPPEHLRRIVGLPSWGAFGIDRREIWTITLMHGTEHARSLGGWRDWRELRQVPMMDLIHRIIGTERRFITVNAITAVKFHSGQRLRPYVEKPCHEQASYLEQIERNPDELRCRELVAAADCVARGKYERRTIAETPKDAPEGWEIEQLSKARGLAAGEPEPGVSIKVSRHNPSLLWTLVRRVRNLIPHVLRGSAGSVLQRAGSWLKRD
jgi:glycosyltransferase involved in cell wall biosynthesis